MEFGEIRIRELFSRREGGALIKKVSAIAVAAGLGVLLLSTPALAHDNDQDGQFNRQNTTVQLPVQRCNNSESEGVVGRLVKNLTNRDKHTGKCHLKDSVDN